MVNLTIRLIRVVILIVVMGTLAACSSMQKPSKSQENYVTSPVLALSVQEKQEKEQVVSMFQKEAETPVVPQVVQSSNQIDPEPDPVIAKIANSFKVTPEMSAKIVKLATDNAYEDFPTRNDILAVIAVESGFQPKVSYRGSHGLMQIEMKSHRDKLHGRSIFDPVANIEIGALVLNQCFNLAGKNKRGAYLAYNSGIGNYLKHHYKMVYYTKVMTQLKFISTP